MASFTLNINAVSARDLQEGVLELARLFSASETSPAALDTATPARAKTPEESQAASTPRRGRPKGAGSQVGAQDPARGEVQGTLADDLRGDGGVSAAAHPGAAGAVPADEDPADGQERDAAGEAGGGAGGEVEPGAADEGGLDAAKAAPAAQAGEDQGDQAAEAGEDAGAAQVLDGGAAAGVDVAQSPDLASDAGGPAALGGGTGGQPEQGDRPLQGEGAGGEAVGIEDVKAAFRALIGAKGMAAAEAVAKKHGIKKPGQTPPELFGAVMADIQGAM